MMVMYIVQYVVNFFTISLVMLKQLSQGIFIIVRNSIM